MLAGEEYTIDNCRLPIAMQHMIGRKVHRLYLKHPGNKMIKRIVKNVSVKKI